MPFAWDPMQRVCMSKRHMRRARDKKQQDELSGVQGYTFYLDSTKYCTSDSTKCTVQINDHQNSSKLMTGILFFPLS